MTVKPLHSNALIGSKFFTNPSPTPLWLVPFTGNRLQFFGHRLLCHSLVRSAL